MNTPRSRPLKRYSRTCRQAEGNEVPAGGYYSGLNDAPEHAKLLGNLVASWSHIEERMIEILSLLLGSIDMPSRQIFRAIQSEHTRIKVITALLEEAPQNAAKGAEYDEIIARFASLNKARNKYVHGLWHTHDSGRVFIAEASANELHLRAQREVTIEELETKLAEMGQLWREVRKLTQPVVSEYLAGVSSQEKHAQPRDSEPH